MTDLKIIAVAQRFSGLLGNAFLLYYVTLFFNQEQIGIFFSFISIYHFHTVIEMGFGYAVIHFLSVASRHEDQGVVVDLAMHRFIYLAVTYLILSSFFGYFLFRDTFDTVSTHSTLNFFLFTIAASVRVYLLVYDFILEGIGKVKHAYISRIIYQLVFVTTATFLINHDYELRALPYAVCLATLLTFLWQISHRFHESKQTRIHNPTFSAEFNAFHKRIALSFVSGFFVYQLVNPAMLYIYGPIQAASVGYFFFAIGACNNLVSALIYPLQNHVTKYYSQFRADKFNFLKENFSSSLSFSLFLAISINIYFYFFHETFELFTGLKPPPALVVLLWTLTIVINQLISVLALCVRASGVDPFVWASILSAVLSVTLMFVDFNENSYLHAMTIQFIPIALIGLPFALFFFFKIQKVK